jgi:alcohol dehydrogenase, propanol-preferring
MVLNNAGAVESRPLKLEDVDTPEPKGDEVLVAVENCGVCRTDLHVIEGDLPPIFESIIPGHEIVGRVKSVGEAVRNLAVGDKVGVPWLHSTCGRCEYCLTGRENLCDNKVFTGYTVNGGYAEFAIGREGYAFKLAKQTTSAEFAPFMCAGIIGYRALKLALPAPGGRIGFFGFGGSAHITLQLASKLGYATIAYSRNPSHLELAKELGASETVLTKSVDSNRARTLDGAVVFAPVGSVVIEALKELKKGGTVSVASIHSTPIPQIDYDRDLFGERKITSVESNTRSDAREFLELAVRLNLTTRVTIRKLAEANDALIDLKKGNIDGAFVLDCSSGRK